MTEGSRSHDVDYIARDTWHVVPDTSALLGTGSRKDADYRLIRPATLSFLAQTCPPRFYLSIPQIVVIEMANHYREELPVARDRLESALRDMGQLLGKAVTADLSSDEPGAQADSYEEWFAQELMRHGARIQPLPGHLSGIKDLIQRELSGRKPFGERRRSGGNRGDRSSMRDAVLWETILELCRRERRSLAFITGNTQDFADDTNSLLHPDLLSEFDTIRSGRQEARLYRSIREFADIHLGGSLGDAPAAASPSSADASASAPSISDTTA